MLFELTRRSDVESKRHIPPSGRGPLICPQICIIQFQKKNYNVGETCLFLEDQNMTIRISSDGQKLSEEEERRCAKNDVQGIQSFQKK